LRFDGRASFKTWLFAVIRLTAHEGRRRLGRLLRHSALLSGMAVEVDSTPGALERLCADAEQRRVERLLARLSGRQREVLRLVFYHDLTLEQAAQAMGVTIGSARTHYQRGKDRLRKALERDGLERGTGSERSANSVV
jgi:RNA polymerase sigma-70 factor (ECF subfamily)